MHTAVTPRESTFPIQALEITTIDGVSKFMLQAVVKVKCLLILIILVWSCSDRGPSLGKYLLSS